METKLITMADQFSLRPPILSHPLTRDSWEEFTVTVGAYIQRGGLVPVRNLISAKVLPLLKIRLQSKNVKWDKIENSELISHISELYAPATKYEAKQKLRKVQFPEYKSGNLSDAVSMYAAEFVACVQGIPTAVVIPKKKVTEMFISKLKPSGLRQSVELEDPATLEDAVSAVFEQLHIWSKVDQQVSPASKSKVGSDRQLSKNGETSNSGMKGTAKNTSTLNKKKTDPTDKLVCFGCGRTGHVKPDCTHQDEWSDKTRGSKRTELKPQIGGGSSGKTTVVAVASNSSGDLPNIMGHFGKDVQLPMYLDTCATTNVLHPRFKTQLMEAGAWVRPRDGSLSAAGNSQVRFTEEISIPVLVSYGHRKVTTSFTAVIANNPLGIIASWEWMQANNFEFSLLKSPCSDSATDKFDDHAEVFLHAKNIIHDDSQLQSLQEQVLQEVSSVFHPQIVLQNPLLPPFKLEVTGASKIRSHKPRRVAPKYREFITAKIQELCSQGVIEKSSSPYAAPVVVAPKKGGKLRLCVDFRDLNAVSKRVSYPLPNSGELLDRLAGKKYFAALDLRDAYHQIPVAPESQPYLAFVTTDGVYQYKQMPFGVTNGASYMQQVMSTLIMPDLIGQCCEVFIDDIIVYGSNRKEYISNLRLVLQRLRKFDLRLKLDKCQFGLSSVEYLGHVISATGITMSSSRREAVFSMLPPKTTKQLRSFLGFTNYFRRHVHNYAQIAKPLTSLCSKIRKFVWGAPQQQAFERLRSCCANSPMLAFLDYSKPIYLETDASDTGCGGHLFQYDDDGLKRSVAFVSVAFNDVQQRWSTYEQEAYAIYFCIIKFQHFLKGSSFIVKTDHRNLKYIDNSTTPKVMRWRLALSEYDFIIQHLPGMDNPVADGLSRVTRSATCAAIGDSPNVGVPRAFVGELTPEQQCHKVHNALVGHVGEHQMFERLVKLGVPPSGLRTVIRNFIHHCAVCHKIRLGQGKIVPAIKSTKVDQPFTHLMWDTIGPFAPDTLGNAYVTVVIDRFTRFIELIPTPAATSEAAATSLLSVVGRYGLFQTIHSDKGRQFDSAVIAQLLRLLNIDATYGAAYRPQSQGVVERSNRETVKHLRAMVVALKKGTSWSSYLPLVQRVCNANTNRATGCAPAELLYGKAVDLNRYMLTTPTVSDDTVTYSQYIQDLITAQEDIITASEAHQQQVVEDYLRTAPPNPTTYSAGDLVLIKPGVRPKGAKLQPRWLGPMAIIGTVKDEYQCQDLNTGKIKLIHAERIKLYNPDSSVNSADAALWDEDIALIEKIVSHTVGATPGRWKFQCRWVDYGVEHDTWEPLKHVKHTEAFARYVHDHALPPFPPHKYPLQ